MGAGAGKSTLLEVLAMQAMAGQVRGAIWLNGVQASRASLHRMTVYISQVCRQQKLVNCMLLSENNMLSVCGHREAGPAVWHFVSTT